MGSAISSEFNPKWMAGLIEQRKKLYQKIIYMKIYQIQKKKKIFENYNNYKSVKNNLYEDLLDENMHSLELINWLNNKN